MPEDPRRTNNTRAQGQRANPPQRGRRPQGQSPLRGNKISQNEFELFDNLVRGEEEGENYVEVKGSAATGNLDKEELRVERRNQEALSLYRFIAEQYGVSSSKHSSGKASKETEAAIDFINLTSKSKGGFGVKAVRTDRIIRDDNVYSQKAMESESETILDKIEKKLSGGSSRPVLGEPDLGNWGNKRPQRPGGSQPNTSWRR